MKGVERGILSAGVIAYDRHRKKDTKEKRRKRKQKTEAICRFRRRKGRAVSREWMHGSIQRQKGETI